MSALNAKNLAEIIMSNTRKVVLDTKETAAVLGISIKTLEKDRADGVGIPYCRLNGKEKGKPLYSVIDIANHIENSKQKTLNNNEDEV